MATTADALITKVLRRCLWPSSNAPLSNAEILAIADEVLTGDVWPAMVSSQGDYGVSVRDYTLEEDVSRYKMPERMYGPVRDVLLVDEDGLETSIPAMTLEDLGHTDELGASDAGFHYFIDGDFIGLYPTPEDEDEEYTLRLRYFSTPGTLVLLATATTIDAVDLESAPTVVDVVANSGSWDDGDLLDIIGAGVTHQLLVEGGELSAVSGLSFTFEDSLAGSGIRVGDYVSTAGTSPILQVPDHMVPWLVAQVAAEALITNDPAYAKIVQQRADNLRLNAFSISKPRSVAEPNIIVTRNSPYRQVR